MKKGVGYWVNGADRVDPCEVDWVVDNCLGLGLKIEEVAQSDFYLYFCYLFFFYFLKLNYKNT